VTSRSETALAALVLVALITAGCSNAPATTVTGDSGTTTSTRDQAVKFAECMRANGVKNFPDPSASGDFAIDTVANRSGVDTSSAVFTQARSACKDLEPSGFTGHRRTPEQQQAALKFAQCIRDNGVKDFPARHFLGLAEVPEATWVIPPKHGTSSPISHRPGPTHPSELRDLAHRGRQ
jgi:hypothetical protein